MKNNVTLKNRESSNYLGAGATVNGGSFIMDGGTIQNCGIKGGSVCYGGGVAVFNGGYFQMNGGTITDCYASSDYIDDYDPSRCFTAQGGGVFVADGSVFTMNGGTISNCTATNFGGGIAMDITYDEVISNGFGYPKSNVTINGGTIAGNQADCGGGVFASGYFYSFASVFYGDIPSGSAPSNPGLFINGGEISANEATDMGGGVLVAMLRPAAPVRIHNAEIKNNTADNGAGIENFGFWTQMDIDGCTITGNSAVTNGGGILLSTNSSNGYTNLKNTIITGNTSGDRGAGVYYDADSKLNISGTDIIQGNKFNGKDNNLNILSLSKPVYVTGDLTGSQIGLSDPTLWDDGKEDFAADAVSTEYLTSGYKDNNPEVHPSEYFTSDHETWIVDRSVKTITEEPDETSAYRLYTVERHPVTDISDYTPYANNNDQYEISDIDNPEVESISSTDSNNDFFRKIYNELKYRYETSGKYTITDSSDLTVPRIYIKCTPTDNNTPLSSITIQKSQNNDYVDITYSSSPIIIIDDKHRGGSIKYTSSKAIQAQYPDSKKLVLKITGTSGSFDNYTFSDDYTETTVEYVNSTPPSNTLYEYDKETGDINAKLIPKFFETKYAKSTIIESGTDNEVRLVRTAINYHINNAEIQKNYDNDDIFTDEVEAAIKKEVKVGDVIKSFYLIPEATPTKQDSCPYIFKGWYYDQDNDNDKRPVKFGEDVYAKDIYAHWIKVNSVAKDDEDDNILPDGETEYGGFDLAGVQVREGIRDLNFGEEKKPGGLRFLTSLSMDVVDQINAITGKNNIEYGYVAATDAGWIGYHNANNRKLLYVSKTANGFNTLDPVDDENYFGFANNVKCTSKKINSASDVSVVRLDHRNYHDYLLYTLVITYENVDESAYKKDVLARPYIKYTDANGLERVAYSEYRGNANTLGGCYTSYNTIASQASN